MKTIGCRKILIVSFFLFLTYALYKITTPDNWSKYKQIRFAKQPGVQGKEDSTINEVPLEFRSRMTDEEEDSLFAKYNYSSSSYQSFIHFTRDVYKSYDAFFHKNVICVRDNGVPTGTLEDRDFVILPNTGQAFPIQTNIDVGYMKSEVEKRAALQRVDKALAAAHKSIHKSDNDAHTHTGTFYDYATWGMQRWSGLQGYHYGIFNEDCKCMNLPCAQANLFIYIISGLEGNGKRFLDSGCGWAPLGRLLSHEFKNIQYTGITSSEKGVEVAKNFTVDFGYDQHSKIVRTNFIEKLPFKANSFDVVFNVESLFHHPNHASYLMEVSRILDHGGQYRILDYFNPKTREDLMDEEKDLCDCVSDYWGFANFPEYRNFEESAKAAGLLVKHRYDLYDKIRPFAVQSLTEDLQEIERYMTAVARGDYDLPGLFDGSAFDKDGNLRHIELQNLSEFLGSKCNSLLLANGVMHYTMYILEKP